MIISSSNIRGEAEVDIYKAWMAKMEQAYKKAYLSFGKDSDFPQIQQIYDSCMDNVGTEDQRKKKMFLFEAVLRNIVTCIGIVILTIALIVDKAGSDYPPGNVILLILAGCIVLTLSAFGLFKKESSIVDCIVRGISGLLMLWMAFIFDKVYTPFVEFCACILLIVVAVSASIKRIKR